MPSGHEAQYDWTHYLLSSGLVTRVSQWQSVTPALDALKCDLCPSQMPELLLV